MGRGRGVGTHQGLTGRAQARTGVVGIKVGGDQRGTCR